MSGPARQSDAAKIRPISDPKMQPEENLRSLGHPRLHEEPRLSNLERVIVHPNYLINQTQTSQPTSKLDQRNTPCNMLRYKTSCLRRDYAKSDHLWLLTVSLAFILGMTIGLFLISVKVPISKVSKDTQNIVVIPETSGTTRTLNSINESAGSNKNLNMENFKDLNNDYSTVSFTGGVAHLESHKTNREIYPKGMTEDMKDILKDNKNIRKHDVKIVFNVENVPNDHTILYDNIYWGPRIEEALPEGYNEVSTEIWENYVKHSEVIKMEVGCGRMHNRLVTFKDGLQACVRYRQNTDQIQGEIFSFYVGRLLNLTNLAPTIISVVDLKDNLWQSVAADIASAQWNTNRAVVLTQYIPSLESAPIPDTFKPSERHLNKFDVMKMALKENEKQAKNILIDKLKKTDRSVKKNDTMYFEHIDMNISANTLNSYVELAQWSDLIVFDYLTANLDRIVNNLFNFQWNVNIMDGPAHNLARKIDSRLLMFLDNESGLLHGYRLLKKYNVYHSLMLDNLCVFRKSTVSSLRTLFENQSVGAKIHEMFHKKNNAIIRDILPPLPEKNAKILYERIGNVLSQVQKCEQIFSKR